MKIEQIHPKIILLSLALLLCVFRSAAQLPVCTDTGGILYYDVGINIYNFDPAQPVSATNPVLNTIPFSGLGLAVGANINAASPPITFYTTMNGFYQYYDGSEWVNTQHLASAVNIGAGGGYIYGIIPGGTSPTQIYQYDGTGDDQLVLTIPGPVFCLYDIIADCDGNFYVLNTGFFNASEQWMRKYSPAGVLLHEWHLNGVPLGAGGGGYGIIDNAVFFDNSNGQIYKGVVTGDTLDFSVVSTLSDFVLDFGNCPKPLFSSNKDTVFYCGNTATLTAQGTAPYTYVVSGNATLTGNGPSFEVSSQGMATVVIESSASNCGNDKVTDTFIIVPPPVVDAGPDDTLSGCGTYRDTLQGSLAGGTSWVNYGIQWAPGTGIVSGGNTLQPVINPAMNTDYILSITTDASQGACSIKDTVSIAVKDRSVYADFSFAIHYGCAADTVSFTSISMPDVTYLWDFGDGSLDTVAHPTHIYPVQGTYMVKLNTQNNLCAANTERPVNTAHPLSADFSSDPDTVCVNSMVTFTNQSTVTNPDAASYLWEFGDGNSDVARDVLHQYAHPGLYTVKMVATDFVPCTDTAYKTIIVDTISDMSFLADRYNICTGQSVIFSPDTDHTTVNLHWDFGDDNQVTTVNEPSQHAYDIAGVKPVQLLAHFRACPDISFADTIRVHALPLVNLGPDTALCLDGKPIMVYNHAINEPGDYQYLWSTGETTDKITIRKPGEYALSLTNGHDCTVTETISANKDCYIDIPNAFTPNGDGTNDYFFPRQLLSRSVTKFKMQVFDRWGQVVFETAQTRGRGWDGTFNGKDQPQGVYIYTIDVETAGTVTGHYQGNITLVR